MRSFGPDRKNPTVSCVRVKPVVPVPRAAAEEDVQSDQSNPNHSADSNSRVEGGKVTRLVSRKKGVPQIVVPVFKNRWISKIVTVFVIRHDL